jgi:uncharacterized membrane protein YidH (DUF202 family)
MSSPEVPPVVIVQPTKSAALQTFLAWVKALISTAVSSGAGGVALVAVDPATFNFHTGLPKLAEVCGVLALIHVAGFLQKSPIPGVNLPDSLPGTNRQ